ncbi:MAG: IS200/IS605 family element transposase accessory protein TnpB [Okeania sp. SIO2C2]|uniref:RNA-guided endonuclease InsQ/TnpB family protein n=1 Tax=Okeania sp. SIO2C2 TaxID=2607787 RepID=UPI0013B95EC3|nr:RNA-guided endonuclease TnpB family protein [Okeania sp. SIO2C2]NEP90565.1 IS200/IS605 family element transposase accessory protein TnpB [Okeania sp. SIO2C2]
MKSFKTKLKLNNQQKTIVAKHAGVARHAYNWGLATCIKEYEETQKRPSAITLHKRLVAEVKSINPWYYEVSKCAPQQALRDLERAFKNFLTIPKRGFPKFKKKGGKDSFYLEGSIKILKGNYIKLPRIGIVKTYEILPSVLIKNVTISKRAGNWYISFKYDLEPAPNSPVKKRAVIGVDVGINTLATCSDGTTYANVKAYRQAKKRLVRHQGAVSKKVIGSKNRIKAVKRLAKAHKKVANIRADTLHKITTWLAKNHSTIVIEDLNVSGMLKNHQLASAIADCGFYEFKRQLTYKCEWYGSELVIADRFYPSSQICSHCGHQQKMSLSMRTYECGHCGFTADRDFNAAVNLENYVSQ